MSTSPSIELTRGYSTIVDFEDYENLNAYNWYTGMSRGLPYATREVKNKAIKMHRLLIKAKDGEIVDHINGNTLDNRKCNLRLVNRLQNAINAKKRKDGLSSKYKGVNKRKLVRGDKYRAYIQCKGKKYHIGSFTSEIEAAKAYNKKAIELFGKYARLNIIEEK